MNSMYLITYVWYDGDRVLHYSYDIAESVEEWVADMLTFDDKPYFIVHSALISDGLADACKAEVC